MHITGLRTADAVTDFDGRFIVRVLPPGIYRVFVDKSAYSAATSGDVVLAPAAEERVIVPLSIVIGSTSLRTIGSVSVSASGALTKSSIISKDVSPDQVEQLGYFRAADLIRTLPQVNRASNSETAAPGDDYPFDIRGIGSLETTTLLDGHPIGNGVSSGYNFQVSPTFGLRNIQIAYGSGGSDLSGVDAVGGVIDMQTLEPTRAPQAILNQGYGTFQKLATTVVGTGTTPNWRTGYALALGVRSIACRPIPAPGITFRSSRPVRKPSTTLPAAGMMSVSAPYGSTMPICSAAKACSSLHRSITTKHSFSAMSTIRPTRSACFSKRTTSLHRSRKLGI